MMLPSDKERNEGFGSLDALDELGPLSEDEKEDLISMLTKDSEVNVREVTTLEEALDTESSPL